MREYVHDYILWLERSRKMVDTASLKKTKDLSAPLLSRPSSSRLSDFDVSFARSPDVGEADATHLVPQHRLNEVPRTRSCGQSPESSGHSSMASEALGARSTASGNNLALHQKSGLKRRDVLLGAAHGEASNRQCSSRLATDAESAGRYRFWLSDGGIARMGQRRTGL